MDLAVTERRGANDGSVGRVRPRSAGPAEPPREPRPTRPTYRTLLLRGLAPTEAANLTAWISGLDVGDVSWTLPEINRLLFLRELGRRGRWVDDETGDGSGPAS